MNDVEVMNKDEESAIEIIHQAQALLAAYCVPDSGISEHQIVNDMLGLFDGPRTRRFNHTIAAEEREADNLACEADRKYSEGQR